ncbi:MAG: hypothetical protein L6Q72_13940, partial [Burkholderiaceae bacterium]|nr:hypothetical protein [Burkholderiaceae bacterium]
MTTRIVACLCAAWCDTCGAWRAQFERVAAASPQFAFRWIDIEDEADLLGRRESRDLRETTVERMQARF